MKYLTEILVIASLVALLVVAAAPLPAHTDGSLPPGPKKAPRAHVE